MTTISLTDSAAERIKYLVKAENNAENNNAIGFRIIVEGGGCSGFQYKFSITREIAQDDIVVEKNGAKLIVDNISLELIKGSTLDFINTLAESRFDIKNPNSSANCGCGNSFNV